MDHDRGDRPGEDPVLGRTWEGPPLDAVPGPGALTIGGFLLEVCAQHAEREALVFDDPRSGDTVRWTYAELERQARTVAAGLGARGVGLGTRVAIVMGNRPEAVAAIFGTALVGGVAVPLSTFATPAELTDLLARSAVAGVLGQAQILGRGLGDEVQDQLDRHDLPFLDWSAVVGHPSWDELLAEGARWAGDPEQGGRVDARAVAVTPGDPGLILFSSGTTGEPKGMVHQHQAPVLQFRAHVDIFRRTPGSRVWAPLPLFWTAGLTTALGSTLAAGGCFVLQETFEPGAAIRLLERERVTEPYTLPHQAAALAEHPDWASADLSSLREVYGKSAYARHPTVDGDPTWTFPLAYGMSETCGSVVSHHWSSTREEMQASTGHLLPGVRLRVIDPETGELLGPGRDGELTVAGPMVIDRYVGRTREESLDADGFLHTGDAGYVDADGAVHWTGRRTEMIKTAGANVSPAELERALRACPSVRRAKVVGLADDRLGEVVTLCVEPAEGTDPSPDDLRAFLAERVARYKVPKHVLFFAPGEIPTTGGDTKVRDQELVAMASRRLASTVLPHVQEAKP